MKAGLVINAFVAAAFQKFGGAPCPVRLLITADEEIASPSSRPVIEREAAPRARCYNSEPGRPTGNVVTGRKGGVFMRFEIAGKAAHSGGNFAQGISAIGELAHKIVQIHALTDLERASPSMSDWSPAASRSTPRRPMPRARSTCATSSPPIAPGRWRAIEKIIATPTCRARRRSCTSTANSCRWCRRRRRNACSTPIARRRRTRPAQRRGRIRRRLRRFRLHRERRHADDCGVGPVGGNAHTARGISRTRQHRPARPGAARWRSSGRASNRASSVPE